MMLQVLPFFPIHYFYSLSVLACFLRVAWQTDIPASYNNNKMGSCEFYVCVASCVYPLVSCDLRAIPYVCCIVCCVWCIALACFLCIVFCMYFLCIVIDVYSVRVLNSVYCNLYVIYVYLMCIPCVYCIMCILWCIVIYV